METILGIESALRLLLADIRAWAVNGSVRPYGEIAVSRRSLAVPADWPKNE